jgi:hypothetical protein
MPRQSNAQLKKRTAKRQKPAPPVEQPNPQEPRANIIPSILEVAPFELYDRASLHVPSLVFNESDAGVTAQFIRPQPALLFQIPVNGVKEFSHTNLLGQGGQLQAGQKMRVTALSLNILENGNPACEDSRIWWTSSVQFKTMNRPRLIAPAHRFLKGPMVLDVELDAMMNFGLWFETSWPYHPRRHFEVLATLTGELTQIVIS